MDEPPAAAEPCDFFSLLAPAAAEPSAFFSVDADELPLAAGELALPDVLALPDALSLFAGSLLLADGVLVLPDALPEALPWASVLGFCSWLIDGVWPACDSCFFSCATTPNDSIAAATATAMGLNFIESPFLDIPVGELPRERSKRRANES